MTLAGRFSHAWRERRPRWPRRIRPRGSDVVVLYHRIAREAPDPAGLVVDPQRFRRQLEVLGAHFDVVPAADILTPHIDAVQRPRAAITFDDGYADNLHVAAPVLRGLGLPATLFVVTDALDDEQEFWWDRLAHLVSDAPAVDRAEIAVGRRRLALDLHDEPSRHRSLGVLNHLLMQQPPDQVELALARLRALAGRGAPATCERHRRLTRPQVVALSADSLWEIGSHTCTHSALRRLTPARSAHELTASRAALAHLLGRPPRLVSYPYGAPGTVGRGDARRAREAGYDLGFVNVPGPTEGVSPFAVPRISVGQWEPAEFLARISRWSRRGPGPAAAP